MFEAFRGMDTLLSIILLFMWGITLISTNRLVRQSSKGKLRFNAWVTLVVLMIAMLLVVAKLVIAGFLLSLGWWFAVDNVLLAILYLLPASIAIVFLTIPRLWKMARRPLPDTRALVEDADRCVVAEPKFHIPIQILTLASLVGVYLAFNPLSPSYVTKGIILFLISVVTVLLLWILQRNRYVKVGTPEWRPVPRLWVRMVKGMTVTLLICIGAISLFIWSMFSSKLPESMSMMDHSNVQFGGGTKVTHAGSHDNSGTNHTSHNSSNTVSVTELTGPRGEKPDKQFTLTAMKKKVELSSGRIIEAWTFDGNLPGTELRVTEGDLVEVTLINKDIEDGVTIHWHGVDVPNAEDGVAGLTQDSVQPGEQYTYRFRAEELGTHWYHSHQVASEQVKKGLYGSLIILPKAPLNEDKDMTVAAHSWQTTDGFVTTINSSDTLQRQKIAPGTKVRLRLVNTDGYTKMFALTGTPFQIAAIDGNDINEPTDIVDTRLDVAAGGRYDVTFTMQESPVLLNILGPFNDVNPEVGILMSPNGEGEGYTLPGNAPVFDASTYGSPTTASFDLSSDFDREYVMVLDNRLGFYNGMFTFLWTINGEVYPNTPTFMVREGDLVKTTFVNRSFMEHPMHLHGHHMLVLSKNGEPVSGSPWIVDTLNVFPGETYEVAFRADNPGIWMDHCHILDHAAFGMTMHLAYEGVTTPFEVGKATNNQPD